MLAVLTDSCMRHWRWLLQCQFLETDAVSGHVTACGSSQGFGNSNSFSKYRNQKLKQSPTSTESLVFLATLTYTVSWDFTASLVLSTQHGQFALAWLLLLFALFLLCIHFSALVNIKCFNYGNKVFTTFILQHN